MRQPQVLVDGLPRCCEREFARGTAPNCSRLIAATLWPARVLELPSFNAFVDHPGGCFTCRWFGERIDVAVRCARPGYEHVRSQADRGCAFWQREPGTDDDLPTPMRYCE